MAKTRKMKVLVVDNEQAFASTLADHLGQCQIEAKSVFSGEEALASVSEFAPDIIIVDLQMPDMSGLDVLARVKVLDPAIEVILLTGNGSFDFGIASMQLGAFDYILKPVDLDQLLEVMAGAYQKRRKGR